MTLAGSPAQNIVALPNFGFACDSAEKPGNNTLNDVLCCVGIGVRLRSGASLEDRMNPELATLPGSSRVEFRAGRRRSWPLPAGPSPGRRPGYRLRRPRLPAAPSGVRGKGPSLGPRVPIQSPSPVGQRFSAPRVTRRAGVPASASVRGPAGKGSSRLTVAVATPRRSAVSLPQALPGVLSEDTRMGGWGTCWPTIAGRKDHGFFWGGGTRTLVTAAEHRFALAGRTGLTWFLRAGRAKTKLVGQRFFARGFRTGSSRGRVMGGDPDNSGRVPSRETLGVLSFRGGRCFLPPNPEGFPVSFNLVLRAQRKNQVL